MRGKDHCDSFILYYLLPTPSISFSLDGMLNQTNWKTFWFFQIQVAIYPAVPPRPHASPYL